MESENYVKMFQVEEKSLQLIEEYKKRECLWNPKHEHYYKRPKKDQAWLEIAAVFGLNSGMGPKVVESKMASLLASYRRELAKENNAKEADKEYTSRWFGTSSFSFLQERYKPKKRAPPTPQTGDDKADNAEDPLATRGNVNDIERHNFSKMPRRNAVEETTNQSFTLVPNLPADECRLFLELVYSKMMGFSDKAKRKVQREINEVLYKAEDGEFDK